MRTFFRQFIAIGLPVLLNAESSSCELSSQADALMQLRVANTRATLSNESSHDGVIDKVVFIKLHAVGSSTLTAILHRYCEFHGKNCFVYPEYIHPGSTVTDADLLSIVTTFQNGTLPALDIWPNHVNMKTKMLDTLIPGNFKISLFRTPLTRIMSAFRHGTVEWVNATMASLQRDNYTDYCGAASEPMSDQLTPDQVQDLDFVLLTEQYDLSLMMMRHKLGWSLFDMMYRRLKDDHPADIANATASFEEYLSQPLGALNNATRFYLQNCIGGNESAVYLYANRTFYEQWDKLSSEEQVQIKNDEAWFAAARNLLEQCCENNPFDSYCVGLLEDNVEWNERYQAENRTYATMQLHRASVSSNITQPSSCMSLVKTALGTQ